MRSTWFFVLSLLALRPGHAVPDTPINNADLLNINVRRLNSDEQVNLAEAYRGKVVLIVNTASKCGFTYQYEQLEALYAKYRDRGLLVLGFPSNDFAGQEPGSEAEIQAFCRLTYDVQFPMFAKTHVRKNNADPLYQRLGQAAGEYPSWNFHKYVIDRRGKLVASYSSFTKPNSEKMLRLLEALLYEKAVSP